MNKPEKFVQGLKDLSEFEMQFLLAYCGVEPVGKPRNVRDAYLAVRPHVKKISAQTYGRQVLARIRSKGALPEFFEARNLGINRAIDLLEECTRAETVKIVRMGGGVWDYASMPDYRTRLRAARLLLEIHGVVGPEALVNVNVDNRQTFAQAIAEQAETELQKRLESSGGRKDATNADYTDVE